MGPILERVTSFGALGFGLVVGWVVYRTLRRTAGKGLGDIATVLGAVGGAAVTALFPAESGAFGFYCIGLAIGFFGYAAGVVLLARGKTMSVHDYWLGETAASSGGGERSSSPIEDRGDRTYGFTLNRPGATGFPGGSVFYARRDEVPLPGAAAPDDTAELHVLPPAEADADSDIDTNDEDDGPASSGRSSPPAEDRLSRRFGPLMPIEDVLDWIPPVARPPIDGPQGEGPRVLNANFAEPPEIAEGRMMGAHEGLVGGREYDLLVEVGPRWAPGQSIVSGPDQFPEAALPPNAEGHEIRVVVVSEDLLPRTAVGSIWLPSGSGRSEPMIDGERSREPGPLRLRLKPRPRAEDPSFAWGRISLYHENNLLQSASIRAGIVARAGDLPGAGPRIAVDFVLSKTFAELDSLATRGLDLGGEGESRPVRVALNLTMNRDASGRHRIVVNGSSLRPGWMAYDPGDAAQVLDESRRALAACYWKRDGKTGQVLLGADRKPTLGIDPATLERPTQAFLQDLWDLAEVGNDLFNRIFLQVVPDGLDAGAARQWIADLRASLADSSVIQVSRTSLANYVFPWGLVYQHPLYKPPYQYCPVIQDLWMTGTPDAVAMAGRTRCPYHDRPFHRENILCPYGFWGLKHVVEQPPTEEIDPARLDAPGVAARRRVVLKDPATLAVAVADDPKFDRDAIRVHLDRLGRFRPLAFTPPPAGSWDDVRGMLKSPSIAYFLCHDDSDGTGSYLSLGTIDGPAAQRVYAGALTAWIGAQTPWDWPERRPLVFINACHSADLRPGQVLGFVPIFARAGASGVIGTEVSVWVPVAIAAGESILAKVADGRKVGDALRAMRWELAARGNLLGLAYTMYCLADLEFVAATAAPPEESAPSEATAAAAPP